MTVGELIDLLRMFAPDMPVVALYDCGCAEGGVIAVKVGMAQPDPAKPRQEGVLLVVE